MAGPCTRHNAGRAPANDSNTPVPTPAVSCASTSAPAQTPAPAQVPALTLAFASTLSPPRGYIDNDLQRAIKLALKLFVKG